MPNDSEEREVRKNEKKYMKAVDTIQVIIVLLSHLKGESHGYDFTQAIWQCVFSVTLTCLVHHTTMSPSAF